MQAAFGLPEFMEIDKKTTTAATATAITMPATTPTIAAFSAARQATPATMAVGITMAVATIMAMPIITMVVITAATTAATTMPDLLRTLL